MLRFAIAILILAGGLWDNLLAGPVLQSRFAKTESSWIPDGKAKASFSGEGLQIKGEKGVRYAGDAGEIAKRLRESNALSFSTWFQPENLDQEGPARIFTFSRNSSERNFTVGQEKDRFEIRLRTTRRGKNGTPGILTKRGSVERKLTHLVFTREANGNATIFLNGVDVVRERIDGDLSNWDGGFEIAVGDEMSGGRPWKGRIVSFGLFDEALSPEQVEKLFDGGPGAGPSAIKQKPKQPADPGAELFETKITTLLTQHCLECHDSVTAEGDLDLSKRLDSHFEEGILVAGKAADSLLWESIENDDMPHKRPPLSKAEKKLIREWIDGGAAWTVDFIDPAIYSRPAELAVPRARRLTVEEYVNTVRDTFGVDIAKEARESLPPDVRADGFSNTAYNLTVDLGHIEAYADLAGILAGKLDVKNFVKRFSNKRDLTDKTMIALIESMGETILRGPLDREEKAIYRGVSTTVASAGGDFDAAVAYVIEAMCQSPRFLYRMERPPSGDSARPVDSYELASRLSYTIWGSSPDGELLRLAREGRLRSPDSLRQQAARMLKDPRAVEQSLEFISQWLDLGRLSHLQPSPTHFPDWNEKLASDMRGETLGFAKEVIWKQKKPLSALLNSRFSYVSPELARHYGMQVKPEEKGLHKVDLSSEKGRGGLLTQGSILTVGGDEASMVTRGLFVLNDLLRGVIKDPPPCVDTTPIESKPGLTQRAVAMERVADKKCGGCHVKFEPLAYGLEKFDGLGAFHEKDPHGNELREDGEILFPGDSKSIPFDTVEELMDLLARSDRVKETMTWKLTQFAMGRPLTARDANEVTDIHKTATEAGGTYEDVMTAMVQSELIRYIRPAGDSDTNH
ncbi:MAG: DUF1592 domain-containing protein [Verrucomicrobiales bacterium]|nr:DUF1592 domain-containing protein [Verrucomicrobiales bacterium]